MPDSSDSSNFAKASFYTSCLELSNDDYKKVHQVLTREFARGLKSTRNSTVKMYLTYVRSLPNSQEKGSYMALDLGGTNFRILLVQFDNQTSRIVDSEKKAIPIELSCGHGRYLFDFIAESLVNFAIKHNLAGVRIALGFTFSFPVLQKGLAEGTLVRWNKGFCCAGTVGKDVVRMLKQSLKRKMTKSIAYVDVVAIINDTTGTLIAGAVKDKNCAIALIVGTGSNACYVQTLEQIEKWPFNYNDPKQVVINCEWGAFGDNNVIDFTLTPWDRALDYESINPGKQIFEKIISGMYVSEIFRRALIDLVRMDILFNGNVPLELLVHGQMETKHMSKIDADTDETKLKNTREAIAKMFAGCKASEEDVKIVHMVCQRVTKRAAYMVATGLWSLMQRVRRQEVSIAYDGSMITLHPCFKKWMEEKMNYFVDFYKSEQKFKLIEASDGSGYGAAIVAAVCYREKRPKIIKKGNKVYEITSVA